MWTFSTISLNNPLYYNKIFKTSQVLQEVLKIVAPFAQKIVLKSLTLLPQASDLKLRKPCTSFGSNCL